MEAILHLDTAFLCLINHCQQLIHFINSRAHWSMKLYLTILKSCHHNLQYHLQIYIYLHIQYLLIDFVLYILLVTIIYLTQNIHRRDIFNY